MRCIKCGAVLTDPGYCSSCGTEIKIYERLIRLSNTYYNMGLEKAKARNLSGAMSDLRYSLELNKNHIQARNLLGLICFEVGDVVSALTEWIISKNLEPEKNIADEYINAIQANPARLETINQTIKKYNQSLLYCQQGSEDLAIIQLKKVLSLNPKLVKAHQLLALLYIRTEEYERAGRELRRALAIDRTDNLSLRYQAELEELTGKPAGRDRKPEKEKETKKPDIISYTSGNETIIMPAGYKENTGVNVILNIFIGLVVGVALMWFLAVPAKVQSVRGQTAEQIREYSDQLAARQAEVNELQSQLDALERLVPGVIRKAARPQPGLRIETRDGGDGVALLLPEKRGGRRRVKAAVTDHIQAALPCRTFDLDAFNRQMREKLHLRHNGNAEMAGDQTCNNLIFIHLASDLRLHAYGIEQAVHHASEAGTFGEIQVRIFQRLFQIHAVLHGEGMILRDDEDEPLPGDGKGNQTVISRPVSGSRAENHIKMACGQTLPKSLAHS